MTTTPTTKNEKAQVAYLAAYNRIQKALAGLKDRITTIRTMPPPFGDEHITWGDAALASIVTIEAGIHDMPAPGGDRPISRANLEKMESLADALEG